MKINIIIVVKKADYSAQPFSNLKTACEHFGLVYNTLVRKEFPIETSEFSIQEKTLIKSVRKSPNTANLRSIN